MSVRVRMRVRMRMRVRVTGRGRVRVRVRGRCRVRVSVRVSVRVRVRARAPVHEGKMCREAMLPTSLNPGDGVMVRVRFRGRVCLAPRRRRPRSSR